MVEIHFADNSDVEQRVRDLVKGAKTRGEVESRLQGCVIKPEPGRLHSVQSQPGGFAVIFMIGAGQRIRSVNCVEPDFNDWS